MGLTWSRLASCVLAAVVALTMVIGIAACGGSSTPKNYPSDVKTSFIKGCTGGGAPKDKCSCMINYIEAHVSVKSFIAGYKQAENSGTDPSWLDTAAKTCVG